MKRLLVLAVILCAAAANAAVVLPVGAASRILIPAAGSAAGANGTFFRSDITLVNFASHDQQVALQWLPQAGSGGTVVTNVITIRAGNAVRSSDFVHDYLNTTGLGSIVVTAVTSAGTVDTAALLYAASRIWTPQPGSTNGTTSQSFDAIPLNAINTPAAALFGMGDIVNSANFRVNVGIVNVDPNNAQTFAINVNNGLLGAPPPPPIVMTIPAMSMQQVPLGNGFASPRIQVTITNTTASTTRSNLWTAYSSTIDNTTGDAWSELAVAGNAPTGP